MQTINNRMTETQIADLFSLAVKLQVKAEESDDRDTAILAYSIQNACSNLTESQREFRAADATIHNLELKLTDMAVQLANAESKCRELAADNSAIKVMNDCLSEELRGYESNGAFDGPKMHLLWWKAETPATDAFLAEVRAQESKRVYESILDNPAVTDMGSLVDWLEQNANDSIAFAALLRKGVQS